MVAYMQRFRPCTAHAHRFRRGSPGLIFTLSSILCKFTAVLLKCNLKNRIDNKSAGRGMIPNLRFVYG